MSIKQAGGILIGRNELGKPSSRDPLNYGSVDFDRDAFAAAIKNKGYAVVWEKATYCPNRTSATSHGGLAPREHRVACTVCDGSGFIYYASDTTTMLLTSMSLSQTYFAYGRWDVGTQLVTALPEKRLHPFDRLTLCNGVARFQELIRRQSAARDRLKYPALEIEHISWIGRDAQLHVAASTAYLHNAGYVVWTPGVDQPDVDSYYTISYSYRPRYVITELLHQHRESTVRDVHYEFPVQAAARLDFLIRDEARDAPETDDHSPFPSYR